MDNAYAKAKQIVKDIDRALHFTPRVTISGTVIITQTASIAELSMVERNFTDDYSWDYTYFGSTKRMKISGDFIAKAGYDLTQLPSIDISADGANVTVVMPPAKITSNELIRERVIQDESGWWNEISLSDRENVQNQFVKHARAAIAASDIRSEADVRLRNQIDKIIRHDIHQPVTIVQPPKH